MNATEDAISRIEALAGRDPDTSRISPLAMAVRGNLSAAAKSIANHQRPNVALITGFFVAHGEPPNCETDGPPGAAMLAAGLAAAGISTCVATDAVNRKVVEATVAAADREIPIDVVSMRPDGGDGGRLLAEIQRDWLARDPPISHVIAIERCGPSTDGRARNARGDDMTSCNAPLEKLFLAGPWTKIGIGDLGNEIGMGNLPHNLVAANVPRGEAIWCNVGCDHLIVGSISNLASAAFVGALALHRPDWAKYMLACVEPAFVRRLLEAAVLNGRAVADDGGGTPRPCFYVDGVSWSVLEPLHQLIRDVVAET